MPKRFTATEIWNEDWFLDMPTDYKLFWYYMLANCDHAGLFKVNIKRFCTLNHISINVIKALEFFNNGKGRIREITSSVWLIEDFFVFQYGQTFNPNNRLHESIQNLYNQQNIKLTSIRGLSDLKDRVKDKDKDKDINSINGEKKISAIYFKDNVAFFADGTSQRLDETQINRLNNKKLNPQEIKKHLES